MPIQTIYKPDFPVQYRITSYTLNSSDNGSEIQFDASSAVTVNLPAVVEAANGYNVLLRNIGSGDLTIDPNGSETIDGASTATLETDQWRWIGSDGTGWKTISRWVPTINSGKVLQVAFAQDGAVATGTTTIPHDNSIPQNTEGDEYMTLSITPESSSSNLFVETQVNVSHSVNNAGMVAALFRDSTTDSFAAARGYAVNNGTITEIYLQNKVASNSTTSTTFKVRAGGNSAGTLTFNGSIGSQLWGGVCNSFIRVTEIET